MQPSWTLDLGEVYDVSSLVVYVNLGINGKTLYIYLNIFQRQYNFTDMGITHLCFPLGKETYCVVLHNNNNKRTSNGLELWFLNTVWHHRQSFVVRISVYCFFIIAQFSYDFIACTRTFLRKALMVCGLSLSNSLWLLLKRFITYRSGYSLGQILSDDIVWHHLINIRPWTLDHA